MWFRDDEESYHERVLSIYLTAAYNDDQTYCKDAGRVESTFSTKSSSSSDSHFR